MQNSYICHESHAMSWCDLFMELWKRDFSNCLQNSKNLPNYFDLLYASKVAGSKRTMNFKYIWSKILLGYTLNFQAKINFGSNSLHFFCIRSLCSVMQMVKIYGGEFPPSFNHETTKYVKLSKFVSHTYLSYKFSFLLARGWEDFKFLGDLLYWGDLISFLGEGG